MADRRIYIFGNPDKTELGFPDRRDLEKYISHDIFALESGRYRYTQPRFADVIVLSRDGLAYGHFNIVDKVKPNDGDREAYPKVKHVYLVASSTLYSNPVKLSLLGIQLRQYGYSLSEEQFAALLEAADGLVETVAGVELPQELSDLDHILCEVKRRIGQSEFRAAVLDAYAGRCAVTGCDVEDALEAAHIVPHCVDHSQSPTNGILLRADIHTLFDRQLIGIHPKDNRLQLAESLSASCYAELQGTQLQAPKHSKYAPSSESLKKRWKQFQAQNQ